MKGAGGDVCVTLLSLARPEELSATLDSIGDGPAIKRVILNGADLSTYGAVLQRHKHNVEFMVNRDNIGVAAAWNQAIVTSPSRYTVISGDDLQYHPEWFQSLSSRIDTVTFGGVLSLSYPLAFSSFLVDKAFVATHGFFDQNFARIYYEDDDWCLRIAEREGQPAHASSAQGVIPRLELVKRSPHRRAPWNSIPNRVYFYRKWRRVEQSTETSLLLREGIWVERRSPEPRWPFLESVQRAYAAGDFKAAEYRYEPPRLGLRVLAKATTNPLFIRGRKAFQDLVNPDRTLR